MPKVQVDELRQEIARVRAEIEQSEVAYLQGYLAGAEGTLAALQKSIEASAMPPQSKHAFATWFEHARAMLNQPVSKPGNPS